MAVTFRSNALTQSSINVLTINCTLPAGLAVDDLMILHICSNSGGNVEPDPLTGWNRIFREGFGGSQVVLIKVTVQADIDAGFITVDQDGQSKPIMANLTAFNGVDTTDPISEIQNTSYAGPPFIIPSITPDTNNSLMVLMANRPSNSSSFSGYSIAVSNPSWTEHYDVKATAEWAGSQAMATGSRASSVSTGLGNIDSTGYGHGIMFSINPDGFDYDSSSSSSSSLSSESSLSSSSSSQSDGYYCCTDPECFSTDATCSHFSAWTINGATQDTTDNCSLHGSTSYFLPDNGQVRLYKDAGKTSLVATGQAAGAGTITLTERNDSGITGSVVWDGSSSITNFTLDCLHSSSSSSDFSSSSTSESSESEGNTSSFSSSSSSTEGCYCDTWECTGDCTHFSAWDFLGTNLNNTNDCKLYILFDSFVANTQQVQVYSDAAYTSLVAIGQAGYVTIELLEQNSSGITGVVTWDLVVVSSPSSAIVECDLYALSSSTSSSSSYGESSSSSSEQLSDSSEGFSSSSSSSISSASTNSSSSSEGNSSSSSSTSSSSSSSSSQSNSSNSSSSSEGNSSSSSTSSSSESQEFTADGWTWGYATPTGTDAVKWTNWKYKESAVEARNTGDYGNLEVKNHESFVSDVKNSLTTQEKLITISYDDYGTGFGSGDVYYRSSNTIFSQDSNEVAGPSWVSYSEAIQIYNRYIQIMVVI